MEVGLGLLLLVRLRQVVSRSNLNFLSAVAVGY